MRRNWAVAAATIGMCAVAVAPAGVAGAEETAQEVISRLQDQGYTVTIDKIGTGPMNKCVVTSVRNPQTITQLVPYVGPGSGGDRILVPQTTSQTVSVSLNCQR